MPSYVAPEMVPKHLASLMDVFKDRDVIEAMASPSNYKFFDNFTEQDLQAIMRIRTKVYNAGGGLRSERVQQERMAKQEAKRLAWAEEQARIEAEHKARIIAEYLAEQANKG